NTALVGESEYTTASIYMVPMSVATLDSSNVNTYSVENMCKVLPHLCGGDENGTQAMGTTIPSNPLCSKADKTHEWGAACADSSVPEVAAGEYSDQWQWSAPKEI